MACRLGSVRCRGFGGGWQGGRRCTVQNLDNALKWLCFKFLASKRCSERQTVRVFNLFDNSGADAPAQVSFAANPGEEDGGFGV
ncbi:MAG: hypothetical protein KGH84_09395, partial [Paracoccaceae bacterium]|nr:hypothetical protein [Paracoccaceae bacterium]